jgi:hypothetical protein
LISFTRKNENSYINNYYQHVYLAEEAYYKKDYQKVFYEMTKASEKCEVLNQRGIYEMQKYAESAARIGKTKKALELIQNLILVGYEIESLKQNEAYVHIIKTSKWKKLEVEYPKLHKTYLKSINLDLRNQILEMTSSDQYHRKLLNQTGMKKDSLWKIINRTDSINDVKLKAILEKYGYPNEKIIGGYAIDKKNVDVEILLFHFDDYDYYSKKLFELIDKGEAPPESLGNFVDSYQRRVKDKKKFIYGMYKNVGEDQILDYDKLDERRISIGLPPMKLKKSIDSLKKAYYGY